MDARKEQIRFLLAGTVVNATDYGIYLFLIHFLSFGAAKGISFTCAGIVGYVINKYWTFKHGPASYAEVGRYVFINFLALGVNVLTNQFILAMRPGAVFLALIGASIVAGVLTFICFKWWVFKT
ncbi:MAG TPA: GtrA family protein [Candidatus Bathyarchaeia archaeon]|nr:GtrA family protein [Candidatus Bathyarchaeia archaeon]